MTDSLKYSHTADDGVTGQYCTDVFYGCGTANVITARGGTGTAGNAGEPY